MKPYKRRAEMAFLNPITEEEWDAKAARFGLSTADLREQVRLADEILAEFSPKRNEHGQHP